MLKVLHVINDLKVGGAENMIRELLPNLLDKGIKCELLLLDGVETHLTKVLTEKFNISIHSIGTNINIYNPLILLKLPPYIRNYDIVHVHLFPAQYWIALAKALFFIRTNLVTTEHSTTNRRRKILIFKLLDRYIYRKYKIVIAVSDKAAENLRLHLNVSSSKICVINNGINLTSIFEAEPYSRKEILMGSNENTRFILKVARFFAAKDHGTLIKAMLYLPENIHLLLVGDGELKPYFIRMVKENNLENRVHFLGIRQDVNRILKSVDIIVMSSVYEGLSLSSLEGMASGKPFLASDVSGLHEIVKDTGILFEPGNSSQLAKEIKCLLENKDLYNSISKKCVNKAMQYDISKIAAAYIGVYKSVCQLKKHEFPKILI
jgi:glycosyltransferase involved in cell wall biosynthesis